MNNRMKVSVVLDLIERVTAPARKAQESIRRLSNTSERVERLRNKQITTNRALDTSQRAVSRSTQDTVKQLAQVAQLKGDIEHFRDLKHHVHATNLELEESRKKTEAAAKALHKAKASGADNKTIMTLARDFEQARAASQQLKLSYDEQSKALEQMRRQLHQAGVSTRDLARTTVLLNQREQQLTATLEKQHKQQQRLMRLYQGFHAMRQKVVRSFHIPQITQTAQEYSELAAKLLLVKSATAVMTAVLVGSVPHLVAFAKAGGMATATFASTASVAMMSKQMDHLSQTTGIASDTLMKWREAGRFGGLEAEFGEVGDIADLFGEVGEKIEELKEKGRKSELAELLNDIGMRTREIRGLAPDQLFEKVGLHIAAMDASDVDKSRWMDQLAKDGSKLMEVFKDNGSLLKEIEQYRHAVGATIDDKEKANIRAANVELSFMRLGLEGVQNRLAETGTYAINVFGRDIRQAFIDSGEGINSWNARAKVFIDQFKKDFDAGGLSHAIKSAFKRAYPDLSAFLGGVRDFARGYGNAFVKPMLVSLDKAWKTIGAAMSSGDGVEAKGAAWGRAMLPITGFVENLGTAVALIITNFDKIKEVFSWTPLGLLHDNWDKVTAVFESVGNTLKSFGVAFGLLTEESAESASGVQVFLAVLAGLAATSLMNRLALGLLGSAFNTLRFSLAPLTLGFKLLTSSMKLFNKVRVGGRIAATAAQMLLLKGRLFTVRGAQLALNKAMLAGRAAMIFVSGGGATALFGRLAKGAGIARKAVTLLWRVFAMTPLGRIISLAILGYNVWANWETIGPRIKAGFSQAFDAISNRLSGWAEEVKRNPAKVILVFATLPIKLAQLGWEAIKGFVQGIWNIDLGAEALRLIDKLVAPLKALNLFDVGASIMGGLVDGIASMADDAVAAVKNVGSDLVDNAKSLLEINSPSKVFMRIGGSVPEGLAVGINKQAAMPHSAVQSISETLAKVPIKTPDVAANDKAFKKTASLVLAGSMGMMSVPIVAAQPPVFAQTSDIQFATVPDAPKSAPNMSGGTNGAKHIDNSQNHYNINITAPSGSQAQDIAKMVRAEMAKLERERKARNRASNHDGVSFS